MYRLTCLLAVFGLALASPALAQSPAPIGQKIQLQDNGLFDFDEKTTGDRQSADVRLNKSQDGTYFLEPLNGAGIGYLETSVKIGATCKMAKNELRASRLNATAPQKGTRFCLRSSNDDAFTFTLEDKSESGISIAQVSQVPAASSPAPAANENRIVYRVANVAESSEPTPVAGQVTDTALVFRTQVEMTNVMPEVAGFYVLCNVLHDQTSSTVQPPAWIPGSSDDVELADGERRSMSETVETIVPLPPSLNVSEITGYSCNLFLRNPAVTYGGIRPVTQQEVNQGDAMVWRGHRSENEGDRPWMALRVEIDIENVMLNRGGIVKTPKLRFDGLAVPAGIAVPTSPADPEPTRPDESGANAAMLTSILQCPEPYDVSTNAEFRRGRNEAGWDTLYHEGGENNSQRYNAREAFYLVRAQLIDGGRIFQCHYEHLTTHRFEFQQAGKQKHENFAAEGFGYVISKTAPGACTPQDPVEWENNECKGTPTDRYRPLCPSRGGYYSDDCQQAIESRCPVACPTFYSGD